jgi:hypothetical protein
MEKMDDELIGLNGKDFSHIQVQNSNLNDKRTNRISPTHKKPKTTLEEMHIFFMQKQLEKTQILCKKCFLSLHLLFINNNDEVCSMKEEKMIILDQMVM